MMNSKELNIIENKIMRISHNLAFVATLGRTLHTIHLDSNEKSADIDGLIIILNIYIKITRKKIENFERYLMECKNI